MDFIVIFIHCIGYGLLAIDLYINSFFYWLLKSLFRFGLCCLHVYLWCDLSSFQVRFVRSSEKDRAWTYLIDKTWSKPRLSRTLCELS